MRHIAPTVLLAIASQAHAQELIEILPPDTNTLIFGIDLSADGSVVVGISPDLPMPITTHQEAFRWTVGDPEPTTLGFLPGSIASFGFACDNDASVIVGNGSAPVATPAVWRLGGTFERIEENDSPGGNASSANATDADGDVIVGEIFDTGGQPTGGFIWRQSIGYTPMPTLTAATIGLRAGAFDVDDAGETAVGFSDNASGLRRPITIDLTTMTATDLGVLPNGNGEGGAAAITPDGAIIVGVSNADGGDQAVRWTPGGGIEQLGPIPGGPAFSAAGAVSADGSVVLGRTSIEPEVQQSIPARAFIWTEEGGMRLLSDYITNELGLFLPVPFLTDATAISDDGRTILCAQRTDPNGGRTFLLRLPQGDPADFNNDGDVDLGDFGFFGAAFGTTSDDPNYRPRADFDSDNDVDLGDFGFFGQRFGGSF